MTNQDRLNHDLLRLFTEKLNLNVSSADTDLIASGIMDSLVFVDMIMHLEQSYGIEVPVAELDFDQFRTVSGIADFLASRTEVVPSGQPTEETVPR